MASKKNKNNNPVEEDGMLTPERVNNIRKGDIVMLNGHPCKIVEIKKSKPGKHGSAKTHFVGLDVFTGKKHEEILREDAQLVNSSKQDYLLTKIDQDSKGVSLSSTSTGQAAEGNWTLPPGDLGDEIQEKFAEGGQLKVWVLSAMGKEQIVSWARVKSQ